MDFSQIGAEPAQTGQIDFSAIGGIPAVGQDTAEDETTALGAAGRGAVGMLPLGEQAYSAISSATNSKPYVNERQELEKEIAADKANHPVARLAGQAAGIAAPAILTGGVTAPESLAGALGQGAAIGGGFGAGNAIDTLAEGGSGAKAAGEVAMGAGLGAAGGAVGQKLAGLMGEAAPKLENFAAKKAAQSIGMGSDTLGNMSEQELLDTGKMLMEKGIVRQGASTQEMFDQAKALQETYGDTIGRLGQTTENQFLTADPSSTINMLKAKSMDAEQFANPDERKLAMWYKRGATDLQAMANKNMDNHGIFGVSFDQLQRLKKSYGNSAFENGAVKNAAAADIYGGIKDVQQDVVKKAIDTPNLPDDMKEAMLGYSKMHPVVSGLQDVLGRERAGNAPAKGFGMMGKLIGQLPGQDKPAINALTSLGLVGAGHPLWGIGAATATLQNPRAMSSMAQGIAHTIPDVAEKLPTAMSQITGLEAPGPMLHATAEHAVGHGVHHGIEGALQQNMGETKPTPSAAVPRAQKTAPTTLNVNHPALAPWKQTFDKNAASAKNPGEKQKSQAVTDFILSQRDPAYAKAKQKAIDEPTAENMPDNLRMADGGVVPEPNSGIDEPIPGLGSTLEGFAEQLKHPTHEKEPVPMEDLPANNAQRFHQPFNPDFRDKLKAFMAGQQEK